MKRENVGKVLVGSGVALTILVLLTRGGKAAPAPPGTLLEQYLARIAAATTIAELNAILAQFTADYSAGKLTYDQYYQLYVAYYYRYYQLPG
jgi:hypothetical protein